MADNNMKLLRNDIKTGSFRRMYILYGEERYLLEHDLSELREAILADGFAEFNEFRLDGGRITARELSDAIESAPAFSEHKLVTVTDLDLYKLNAEDREAYTEALTDIPEYTTLVVVYDTVEYKPDKRQNLYKFLSGIALVVEYPLQEARSLVSWLRRRADALGKRIDPTTAEHMLFVCGSSMTSLILELEKAAAYASTDTILKSDIDAVCERTLEASAFELADAISTGNTAAALRTLSTLEANESEPIVVLAAIGSQMRRLLAAKLALDAKKPQSYLASAAGVPSFAAGRLLTAARRLSLEWCTSAASLCAGCDYALKTSSGDRSVLLEQLILDLGMLSGAERQSGRPAR